MVAAANPLAAQAGLEMLRAGGSAVDAAIATQAVLGLVEPESSGLGGGAFIVLYDPKANRVTTFDGRETAPDSATPTMFLDANGAVRPKSQVIPGGLSVGVPGDVDVMAEAWKKYGHLKWAKLFAPAIRLSNRKSLALEITSNDLANGFIVVDDQDQGRLLRRSGNARPR